MSKLQLKLVNNEQILSIKKLGKACMFEDTGDCVAPATDYCKYCDYGECTGNAYDYCSSDDFFHLRCFQRCLPCGFSEPEGYFVDLTQFRQ